MLNSSKNKKKQKRKGSTLEKSTAIILDKTILESDEEEIEPSEVVELQELKPKTSILGKTWNFVKQIFHTTAPKVMKPDEIVDSEGCSGTGLNIMSEETTEESQINESESCLILSHKKLEYSMVSENNEVRVYECGWNGSEINGGNPLIMEVSAGLPFEQMPDLLKLRIIGTTINYILMEEMKGVGFISQESIEELFEKYTSVPLNDACQMLGTPFKDFIDEHFSTFFKNCYPHGLARLTVVDKPIHSNNFDNFGVQAVSPPSTLKAIESASPTPLIQREQTSSGEPSSTAPIIQEERTTNNQSPFNSSAQSYTTPVESDTELQNVGTANDIKIDDHEALLTPVATPALSSTSVMVDSNETSYVAAIQDLEEDVLDIVTQSVKESKKNEPKIAEQNNDKQAIPLALTTLDITDDEDETTDKKSAVAEKKLVEDMKNDVQNKPLCVPGVEKTAESSNKENNKFLSPSMIYESYDESTKCMGEIETDDKKAQFTVKQHVPSQKQSSNAKETIDKKSDVEKVVKPPEVLFGEKKVEVLGQNFLEEISEDENHVKTGDLKNIAKTHTTAASSSSSATALLAPSLLISSGSSDEEEKKPKLVPPKVNKSTIKPTPVKKKVVVQKPKPVEELSELKSNNRLLEVGLLDDDDSEDDVDKNVKKPTTTSLSNQAKEKNPSKSTSKQDSCALNHGVLADTSDEDQSDVEEVSESDEDKPPVLPLSGASATLPHICLSGASSSEDETVNKYSSSNKKVKSKSIESVKNVRFLNEKYVKRSGSESEGEQFVSLEPTKSEDSYRIDIDKKLVSIDYEEKNSDDSDDEVLSSDDEGPSSLEVSDDDTQQPQDAGYLEQDLMESLDKQIVKDFSKKNIENDLKAKEEEGKKREEKLQELAKKKKEYEKQGPTENGVTRLENYFDNFIIDIEPAKTESPNEAAAVVEKSKSPPEAAQPSKPIEVKKSKSKSPAKEQVVIKVIEGKKEESKPIAKTEIQKPQVESKKEAVKLKEVKVSSIGKYDPSIPIVGEDFIDQISCSEEVVTVKKATPIKTAANKPTSIQPSTVSQTSNAVQRPDPVVEDDFLVEIQASNLAQRPTPVIEDDFLNQIQVSNVVRRPAAVVEDDFLDEIQASNAVRPPAPVIADDFLDEIQASTSVRRPAPVIADDFLDEIQTSNAVRPPAPVIADDFLDEIQASTSVRRPAPVIADDFLDQIQVSNVVRRPAPVVEDDFLDQIQTSNAVRPPAPVIADDFLDQIQASNFGQRPVPVIADDFLDEIQDLNSVRRPAPVVEDDFLEQIKASNDVRMPAPVIADDFLDEIQASNIVQKPAPVMADDFLDQIQASNIVRRPAPVIADDFAKVSSSKPSVAIPDQQSFKSVIIHKSSNIPPVIGDDFLDQIHETKPCAKQPAPVVGDDFLDQIQTSNFAQRRAPIVEDDFLNQIGRSNDIVTVKNGNSSSMPFGSSSSKPSFAVPDDTLAKLINSAEIGVNYDSDGSESTAPETSNRNFTPLEYKIDHYLNVPNFIVVNKMKKEIAQSMPKPKLNHLLNFWLENFSGFPELVIFFQYLQYHIEIFKLVDCLTLKTYHSLIDAVVQREPMFQLINHLVANIPLMCQYKFLIYDDNYPDFIFVNSELLDIQIYPLASGLPTSVMYLFYKKRRWIISDLKKEFRDCSDAEFYRQLNNFLNDRPDLVMLESSKPKATFPEMYIVLNDHISLKLCCFMVSLNDLNVAEKLHLRMDYINSMKQFIPQRPR